MPQATANSALAILPQSVAASPIPLPRQDGQPAIGIGISMLENGNIIALGAAMDRIRADLPVGITVDQIADQPEVVGHSIFEVLKAFAEALGIVLAVSFLSLGLRTGVIMALSVALVLAIVFLIDCAAAPCRSAASKTACLMLLCRAVVQMSLIRAGLANDGETMDE